MTLSSDTMPGENLLFDDVLSNFLSWIKLQSSEKVELCWESDVQSSELSYSDGNPYEWDKKLRDVDAKLLAKAA